MCFCTVIYSALIVLSSECDVDLEVETPKGKVREKFKGAFVVCIGSDASLLDEMDELWCYHNKAGRIQ